MRCSLHYGHQLLAIASLRSMDGTKWIQDGHHSSERDEMRWLLLLSELSLELLLELMYISIYACCYVSVGVCKCGSWSTLSIIDDRSNTARSSRVIVVDTNQWLHSSPVCLSIYLSVHCLSIGLLCYWSVEWWLIIYMSVSLSISSSTHGDGMKRLCCIVIATLLSPPSSWGSVRFV